MVLIFQVSTIDNAGADPHFYTPGNVLEYAWVIQIDLTQPFAVAQ